MRGRVIGIHLSSGGVPKLPVNEAEVTREGIVGDAHNDLEHHGGPDRAVCLYSIERIEALRLEGHPISPGTTGENLTLAGIDPELLRPGARLKIGEDLEIELTGFAAPCRTIRESFLDHAYSRISEKTHSGWSRTYARVITPGRVRLGDPVDVTQLPDVARDT